jgi:hypothetical protein
MSDKTITVGETSANLSTAACWDVGSGYWWGEIGSRFLGPELSDLFLTSVFVIRGNTSRDIHWIHNISNSIQFFIIYVLSQQLQGQLQTQHSVDTGNYIIDQYNIKTKVYYRQTLEKDTLMQKSNQTNKRSNDDDDDN